MPFIEVKITWLQTWNKHGKKKAFSEKFPAISWSIVNHLINHWLKYIGRAILWNQMEQPEFHSCHLNQAKILSSSFFWKKHPTKVTELLTEVQPFTKCTLPRNCRYRFFVLFVSERTGQIRTRFGTTSTRVQTKTSENFLSWPHSSEHVEMHPVYMFSVYQPDDNEILYWRWVPTTRDDWRKFPETPLPQTYVKDRVLHKLLVATTSLEVS